MSNDSDNAISDSQSRIQGRKISTFLELPKVQKTLLAFCISLLDQRIDTHENKCPFLIGLALLGVKENGWHGVETFPSKLSSILKISRFFIIRYAYESLAEPIPMENDSENELDSSDSSDIEGLFPSNTQQPLDQLTNLVDRFMIRGSHSPIHIILDLRAYGLKIARDLTTIGHIDWDNETIFYSGISFSMSNFRGFLHGLVHSTRTILFKELLFESECQNIPSIPWEKIHENSLDNSPFSNFLSNPQSDLELIRSENWLINRIEQYENLISRFEIPGPEFTWNRKRLEGFFDSISLFLEKLLILIHISGGQPARAPEILSLQYGNSLNTGLRNIFYENGLICYVTYYHKGYSVSGSTKIIHRYLPREIGELLVYYLWLIVPFLQRIYKNETSNRIFSLYLFQKISLIKSRANQITSDDFRRIFRRETEIGLGIAINPSQYRHIAIGIARKFLKSDIRFENDDFDDVNNDPNDPNISDDIIDLQAGHSSRVSGLTYARGILDRSGEIASQKTRFREASLVSLISLTYFNIFLIFK